MATVTAPLIVVKRADGTDVYLYKDATFPAGMADGELKRMQEAGFVEADEPAADPDQKPAGNASQADWVDYAKSLGKSDSDLDGLGRDEIRALFN